MNWCELTLFKTVLPVDVVFFGWIFLATTDFVASLIGSVFFFLSCLLLVNTDLLAGISSIKWKKTICLLHGHLVFILEL